MTMRAAAVIPAFNEARSIADVVGGVRASVDRVIVVDDGSTDGTAERARAAGADVVVHDGNRGKGHAVRTGLARVLEGEFTPCVAARRRHAASAFGSILLLAEAERGGAEVVLGERRFQRDLMPASRYHANRIGSRVLSWFVGVPGAGYAVRLPWSSRRCAAPPAPDGQRL
jgi:glycosyltransferase involved in cell wall biosynthesis